MTRGPAIWPTTFASTPKLSSVETSASATRVVASAEFPFVGGEWRRIVRSGSR